MKKLLIFILVLCISCTVLCACNNSDNTDEDLLSEGKKDNDSNTSLVLETPPMYTTYSFDSYQDVIQALTKKSSREFSILRKEQENCGKVYQRTLSKFASAEIKVAVPQINGNPIPIRDKDGYAKVDFLTSELYNLPWLWYHCVVENRDLDVKFSYLRVLGNSEVNSATSYYKVQQLIAPDAPSPENYNEFESYKVIYEKEITLKDGITVTALVSELKRNEKSYVDFYYDGMLISLKGDNELFTDAFWRSFSIAKY